MRKIIQTDQAPSAIGTYSQAVLADKTLYVSGQIPLDPVTMEMVTDFKEAVHQVFRNLQAVIQAAGGELLHIVKLNIFLIDMNQFATVNEIMSTYFTAPYPARAVVQVSRLPKDATIEMDAIAHLE